MSITSRVQGYGLRLLGMGSASLALIAIGALVSLGPATAVGATAPAPASEACMKKVLAELADVESLEVHFHESKRMALLQVPLENEGIIFYARPRVLVRLTQSPAKSKLLVRASRLEFSEGTERHVIDLDTRPEVAVLVDLFVSVLAGDAAAIDRSAKSKVECSAAGWKIRLTPRADKLAKLVAWMEFEGKGRSVSSMHMRDGNGDETYTTFSQLSFGVAPDEATLARWVAAKP